MLIVGGGAALTAIVVFFAWLSLQKLRAAWRERQARKRLARRGFGSIELEEHDHEHAGHQHVH
jgi:hypothetical protein